MTEQENMTINQLRSLGYSIIVISPDEMKPVHSKFIDNFGKKIVISSIEEIKKEFNSSGNLPNENDEWDFEYEDNNAFFEINEGEDLNS